MPPISDLACATDDVDDIDCEPRPMSLSSFDESLARALNSVQSAGSDLSIAYNC